MRRRQVNNQPLLQTSFNHGRRLCADLIEHSFVNPHETDEKFCHRAPFRPKSNILPMLFL